MNNSYRLSARVTFVCLFSYFFSAVQSQKLVYAKAITNNFAVGGNVYPIGIKIDKSGNTYMLGNFEGTADFDPGPEKADLMSAGKSDMFIAKYDADGKYVFAKRMGSESNNFATALAIDSSGNMYITGFESDTVDFDPGPAIHILLPVGGTNMFIAKYDADGNFTFLRSIAGNATPMKMSIDRSANLYIMGYFYQTIDFDPGAGIASLDAPASNHFSDAFFTKYDANGNCIYAKAISGPEYESINGLEVDDSANIYIAGTFSGVADFDPGPSVINRASDGTDIFFAKYNAAAELQFVTVLHNEGQSASSSLILDHAGNFYITGTFIGPLDFDPGPGTAVPAANYLNVTFFIAKYDAAGNYKFVKTFLGEGSVWGRISLDAAGYITLFGFFNGTMDFDVSAHSAASRTASESDDFIARYDTVMNLVYVKTMGGSSFDSLTELGFDSSGNMHVAGEFSGVADFDPGDDVVKLNAISGLRNSFLASYKSDGSLIHVGQVGTYGTEIFSETSNNIAVDLKGNTYITGSFSGSVDFDPGPGHADILSMGSNDAFVAKYDHNGNYVWAFGLGSNGTESGTSIAVDGFGNVYVMGSFSKMVDFDPGPGSVFIRSKGYDDTFFAKYDSNGHYVYAKSIGAKREEFIHDMKIDRAGNLYLAGTINTVHDADPEDGVFNVGSEDKVCFFFAKYGPSGKLIFAKTFGTDVIGDALGLAVAPNGYIYLTGYFQQTVDFDPGPAIADLTSLGKNCVFIAGYDALGNYRFAKAMNSKLSISSNYYHAGHCIAVDEEGNMYVTGNISSTTDFDPGPGVANIICNKEMTMFFARYDAAGNYIYAKGIEGDGYNSPTSLAINRSGELYISGHFLNSIDLDPGPRQAIYSSAGAYDYFIAKYNTDGDYLYSKVFGTSSSEYQCYIAGNGAGEVYITGSVFDMKSVNIKDSTTKLNRMGIFFAKFTDSFEISRITFSAKYLENIRETVVSWSTASRSAIKSFEVLRSHDSSYFEVIHRRSGCTNCATGVNYEYYDPNPFSGKSYYQLKMIDSNDHVSYSKTLTINIKEVLSSTLYVFPVVTNDLFQIFVNNNNLRREVVIQLASAYGIAISQQKVLLNQGDNKYNYSLANKPPGLYYVRVAGKEGNGLAPVWVIKK